ncbi:MAG: hypothetical protein ACTSRA_16690 [Promethearchaeota archaeon]
MSYEDQIDQDLDEDARFMEDEFSTEDIEREMHQRLLVEKGKALPIKRIIVNYWTTSMHGAKLGIKKDAQWQSKSRQFSQDMEIKGDVLFEFDERLIKEELALKYFEVKKAKELGKDLAEIKRDKKSYEDLILKEFRALSDEKLDEILKENNEKLPEIPRENDRKLIIAINGRFWDLKKKDTSQTRTIDKSEDTNDGIVDGKEFLENYLVRKFGPFAPINRRLIIKLFRDIDHSDVSLKGAWMGTVEQSLLNSMQLTFGEKDPLYAGALKLPGFDYTVNLVRSHAITGQRFVLPVIHKMINWEELIERCIIEQKDLLTQVAMKLPMNYYVHYFLIEGKRFTPGTDYVVKDPMNDNKIVAEIDGRAIDIGGRWDIKFKDKELSKDPLVRLNLILFACLVKFHPEVQNVMRRLYKELKKKSKTFSDDQLKAALMKYIKKIEDKRKVDLPDKEKRVDFALDLLRSRLTGNEIETALGFKYHFKLTPHELSMFFNPRRVR